MSTPDPKFGPWSIHYQQPWKDEAANPRLPMPLRVTFLALGNHRANGHANFRQQEVANALGRYDDSGTWVLADRRTVYRAIAQAIEWKLLEAGSRAMCLIVPKHRATGGPGDENEPCKRHPAGELASDMRRLKVVK